MKISDVRSSPTKYIVRGTTYSFLNKESGWAKDKFTVLAFLETHRASAVQNLAAKLRYLFPAPETASTVVVESQ